MNETFMKEKPIFPLLLGMGMPMVLSMLVNSLYNIVDSYFVARISENAMEALSLVFPIQNFINAMAIGFGVGINALIATARGAGKENEARRAATQGVVLSVIHGIILAAACIAIMPWFLGMFTRDQEVIHYGVRYASIAFLFSPIIMAGLAFEKIFQAVGRMKVSMIALLGGCITNIILDPIFIYGLHMGVRGAALATIISQGLSCIWILRFLTGKKTRLRLKKSDMHLEKRIVIPCLGLGLGPFVMQATDALLNIAFNSSLQHYGGDIAVGCMTISSTIQQMVWIPVQGIGQGAQPIISYNFGARNRSRVKQGFLLLLKCCVTYSFALWLAVMLVPQVFAGMFTPDPALIAYSVWAMRIYMAVTLIFGVQIACQQTFIAIGNAKTSLFLACLRKLILLIPLIYILPQFFGDQAMAVYLAEPVADLIAVSVTAILFAKQFKRALAKLEA